MLGFVELFLVSIGIGVGSSSAAFSMPFGHLSPATGGQLADGDIIFLLIAKPAGELSGVVGTGITSDIIGVFVGEILEAKVGIIWFSFALWYADQIT